MQTGIMMNKDLHIEAQTMVDEMFSKRLKRQQDVETPAKDVIPTIDQVKFLQQDNMSIVNLHFDDGRETFGWSKFNPSDIRTIKYQDKKGFHHYKKVSCFDPKVGFKKALVRAVDQLF